MHHYISAQSCSRCCSDVPCLVTVLKNRKLLCFTAFKDLEVGGYS